MNIRLRTRPLLLRLIGAFVLAAFDSTLASPPASADLSQNIAIMASRTCAVMAGTRKLDAQTLQWLQMLGGDLGDVNPVEFQLQRDVIARCPKAYLAYQHRLSHANPFAAHPLLGGPPVSLLAGAQSAPAARDAAPPPDYPVRCLGKRGEATWSGSRLKIEFVPGSLPSLAPGQCAWLDRGFRSGEVKPIVVTFPEASDATQVGKAFGGKLWTIWIRNDGLTFWTTFIALGAKTTKVH